MRTQIAISGGYLSGFHHPQSFRLLGLGSVQHMGEVLKRSGYAQKVRA